MTLPKWSTPERQRTILSLLLESGGLCVYGHPRCLKEEHCLEAYVDGLKAEWKSEDASRRAVEWRLELERLHGIDSSRDGRHKIVASRSGKRRNTKTTFIEGGWSNDYRMVRGELRHHDPITSEAWRESLPYFRIVAHGLNPQNFGVTALVLIPGLGMPVHLWVDVGKALNPSKNARRKARRYGDGLSTEQELCTAAVRDWRQAHHLE